MKQPFYSSEIRWFSLERELFEKIYTQLPGSDIQESKRVDYYLNAELVNTGIKIREGKHEIKVKCSADEKHPLGTIEHWCKWSTTEPNNILHTVAPNLRQEWVAVEKIRRKKMYAFHEPTGIIRPQSGFIDDGGGVEFTELIIGKTKPSIYSFGLEAFGTQRSSRQNLLAILDYLDLNANAFLAYLNMGYPAYLKFQSLQ